MYIRCQILYNPTLEAEQQASTAVAHTDRDKNKRLSHEWRTDFSKIIRALSCNDDLPIDTVFSQVHLAGQYL